MKIKIRDRLASLAVDLSGIAGVSLIIAGIARLNVAAAMIAAGGVLVFLAVRLSIGR